MLDHLRSEGMLDLAKEQRAKAELLAYASEGVLAWIQVQIERSFGWTDESHDLHLDYLGYLGLALDEVTSVRGTFVDLLERYWDPYSDDAFELEDGDVHEAIKGGDVARYCAMRMARLYNVVDPDRLIASAEPYRVIAAELGVSGFLHRPLAEIEAELVADGTGAREG